MTNTNTSKRTRRMARGPQAPADAQSPAVTNAPAEDEATSFAEKRPSKSSNVLALLNRNGGATLDELVEATGWLPHTARAALTGLKKKGHAIERTKADGVSRYAVVAAAAQ